MRITGPADRPEALRTLKQLPELDVNFVDTSDAYGPDVSEELIREALHPYRGMLFATKGGLARTGPDVRSPSRWPEYLIQEAYKSRRRLGVESIGLWQLHRIDPKVPRDEQFGAIKTLLDLGVIRNVGLSEVSVPEIEAASRVFKVATVQNRYNLVRERRRARILRTARDRIPWYPLAAGNLARPGSLLDKVAKRHGVAPSQIALAWVLKRSPVMLPIPGTSKAKLLEENVAAANIKLPDEDLTALDHQGKRQAIAAAN